MRCCVHWKELKKKERKEDVGMLDGVPKALPSLAYSQSVQDRVGPWASTGLRMRECWTSWQRK
jgi:uncharacterized protein YabN with tetrapyrrole methylase and pyrophosphatase domain